MTDRLKWERQQRELACQVCSHDDADWLQAEGGGWQASLRLVAGLDITFMDDPLPPAHSRSDRGTSTTVPTGHQHQQDADPPAHKENQVAHEQPAEQLQLEGDHQQEEVPRDHEHSAGCQQPCNSAEHADASHPSSAPSLPSGSRAVAALAALTFPDLKLAHLELLEVDVAVPYAPGFLGFREVPAFLELLNAAAAAGCKPQLLLVDGFGTLHPRRCGSASHLGVMSGLPTIGVAKTLLRVDGLLGEKQVRAQVARAAVQAPAMATAAATAAAAAAAMEALHTYSPLEPAAPPPSLDRSPPCHEPSAVSSTAVPLTEAAVPQSTGGTLSAFTWLPLKAADGEVLGAALSGSSSTPAGSSKHAPPGRRPVFVSVGHRVGLATAVAIVAACCSHRVPEPIRQADLLSREAVRRIRAGGTLTGTVAATGHRGRGDIVCT